MALEVPTSEVLPGNVPELKEMANAAMQKGEHTKAMRYYTMAIDLAAKSMPRDADGQSTTEDLRACNRSSDGELAKLLSNRSLVYLKVGDTAAALEDAETCVRAEPSFEKGHLRLVAALEATGALPAEQLRACEEGLEACPESEMLGKRRERLAAAVARQHRGCSREGGESEHTRGAAIEQAKRLAADASDPRHVMAAADLGSALATGAFGFEKDVDEAERYLKVAAAGGDVSAQRNLGLLLLEVQRPVEAAEHLSAAAAAGDEEAASVMHKLAGEAEQRQAEARSKLEALAADGDRRAAEMLAAISVQ